MSQENIRVTIRFTGKLAGSLGFDADDHETRRTVNIASPFTYAELKEAARQALYYQENDCPAWENVRVTSCAVN